MELQHLRYFVAVADAGSLTVAAEQSRTSKSFTILVVRSYASST
jgi:DNA-binding transcriptional LysR family regulator